MRARGCPTVRLSRSSSRPRVASCSASSLITGSRLEAEDIVQEAFTRVFQHWDRVREMENPAGYLERTAMNVFRSQYRRATMAVRRTIGTAPEQDAFEAIEDRDVATRALAILTPRQRRQSCSPRDSGTRATRPPGSWESNRPRSGRSRIKHAVRWSKHGVRPMAHSGARSNERSSATSRADSPSIRSTNGGSASTAGAARPQVWSEWSWAASSSCR